METQQVWCVAYDDDKPRMDGSHGVIHMGEWTSREEAGRAYLVVAQRSRQAPKKNLRIETRFVSEWSVE